MWLVFVLILAGLVLIAVELLTPMFGVFLTSAIGCLIVAIWLTFVHAGPVAGFCLLGAAVVLVPAYIALLIRVLPGSPVGRLLFLGKAEKGDRAAVPDAEGLAALVGKDGEAATPLRPVGAVRIDGRRIPARTESRMIDRGDAVRVVAADSTEVVVRKIVADSEREPAESQ